MTLFFGKSVAVITSGLFLKFDGSNVQERKKFHEDSPTDYCTGSQEVFSDIIYKQTKYINITWITGTAASRKRKIAVKNKTKCK